MRRTACGLVGALVFLAGEPATWAALGVWTATVGFTLAGIGYIGHVLASAPQ